MTQVIEVKALHGGFVKDFEIEIVEEKIFIPLSQLSNLERFVRLYHEMDINLEGIETITYLLQRMNEMQKQILILHNRLRMYENV